MRKWYRIPADLVDTVRAGGLPATAIQLYTGIQLAGKRPISKAAIAEHSGLSVRAVTYLRQRMSGMGFILYDPTSPHATTEVVSAEDRHKPNKG